MQRQPAAQIHSVDECCEKQTNLCAFHIHTHTHTRTKKSVDNRMFHKNQIEMVILKGFLLAKQNAENGPFNGQSKTLFISTHILSSCML